MDLMPSFAQRLNNLGLPELRADGVRILQVNLGWRCNQSCKHCHLKAGPARPEVMARDTVDRVIQAVGRWSIPTVDLTGGAPEMNPHFEYLVDRLFELGTHILNRSNLTVLLEPGKEHLGKFLRDRQVELICSLPYYTEEVVDRLRGPGVFQKSLAALRRLNSLGYGREGSPLKLHLAFNPAGAYFPPPQASLREQYARELSRRYDVHFHELYTLLNMPIGRFQEYLQRSQNYDRYMGKLAGSFNPATVEGLMCRRLISVSWEGRLFDCDFHQALNLPLMDDLPQTIGDFDLGALEHRIIRLADHCYGCTAGCGSSCGGTLAEE
jgi:radical SAM/Cys-rich protein